jgi:Na+/H+ antiporter NhaD/arsenite permease-like protein
LPFPPFTWLAKLPLKYETWILSTIGAFVGIALLEVIISAAFPNDGTILIGALSTISARLSSI